MMTKICTDVEQSNKLIELGINVNTADMCYHFIEINKTPLCIRWEKVHDDEKDNSIPAWSLAALFDILPNCADIVKEEADTENEKYMCTVGVKYDIISTFGNNPIDACVEMILKLKEQNLL